MRVPATSAANMYVHVHVFNPPFPVLKAGWAFSVLLLYTCICDVCREWVNEVGFFLFYCAVSTMTRDDSTQSCVTLPYIFFMGLYVLLHAIITCLAAA